MLLLQKVVGLNTWLKAVILLVLLWGLLVYILASKLFRLGSDELQEFIDESVSDQPNQPPAAQDGKHEPSMKYEKLRRRVRQNTEEIWNYFNSEFTKIKNKLPTFNKPELTDEITNVMDLIAQHKRSLISDIDQMRMIDGYEQWRHDEAKSLSDLVQRRLNYLQNPQDCKNARKLVCRMNKNCGYGCQLHHIVYCFILAYATERTLILKSMNWAYNKAGWEEVFHPISETCLDIDIDLDPTLTYVYIWPGQHDSQVIVLPAIDLLIPPPPYIPLSIPADIAQRLMRLHGDPFVFWVGQFLKYLLRPNNATNDMLQTRMEKLGFKKPIVGVHIRRMDKLEEEADFHSVNEYMNYVDDYFLQLEMNGTNVKRRVFLATDEENVIYEMEKNYPSYEIISDLDVARIAASFMGYTDSSFNGIVSDIHMLSLCDYLVCTFSSNVCRIAYEIMQKMYPDASNRFKSLDDIYYFGGQNAHNRDVVLSHQPRHHDEIYVSPGDQIGIAGNHWNGYSKGTNTRTDQTGLFPSFKVNDNVRIADFPTYANVK